MESIVIVSGVARRRRSIDVFAHTACHAPSRLAAGDHGRRIGSDSRDVITCAADKVVFVSSVETGGIVAIFVEGAAPFEGGVVRVSACKLLA
jgi:hypothetical protein